MGSPVVLAVLAAALGAEGQGLGYDESIDGDRAPPSSWAIGLGVEQLDDTFGFRLEARSPRLFGGPWLVEIAASAGWFPNIAVGEDLETLLPWTLFGGIRARLELSLPIAESPHRLFVAAGPSLIVLDEMLTESQFSAGAVGGLGVEFFAGDRYRPGPFSVAIELGGTAHLARADKGRGEVAVARSLATGLMLSAAIRWYPFDGQRRGRAPAEP